tara:strand:+ start:794 stop:2029 length:1236 start_codon:yes stop_codon:yes gene_type:complete
MANRTWTKENDAFIIIERSNNTPYAELATKFNRKFNSKVKVTDLHQRAFKLNITGNTVKAARKPNKVTKALASPKPQMKYFRPTQEQINFVHSMVLNGYDTEQVIQGFEEQHGRVLTAQQIVNTISKPNTLKPAESPKPTKKRVRGKQYSQEEINMISNCSSVQEVYALGLDRSLSSLEQKYYKLKRVKDKNDDIQFATGETNPTKVWEQEPATRRQLRYLVALRNPNISSSERNELAEKAMGTITKIEAHNEINALAEQRVVEKHLNETTEQEVSIVTELKAEPDYNSLVEEVAQYFTPEWDEDDDFDLLCNFYEYSIDEARNRFNRPYGEIASRLEMLIDSTEPEHTKMLMRASKVIKRRKVQQAKDAKMGFWKRRKLRKQAKKEAKKKAKIEKIIAKSDKKLRKLRGD